MSNPVRQDLESPAGIAPPVWLFAGVVLLAMAVRAVFAVLVSFPPADDPAYYFAVARNLAEGRGFVTDVIWQYRVPPETVTHPAGDLWMPLPSVLMAAVFFIAGVGWKAAQVPGVLAGTALAGITYWTALRVFAGQRSARCLAGAAGLLVALSAVMAYQSASGDSSALFAVLAAGGLAVWCVNETGRDLKRPAVAGILFGLAYLARSDAVFVAAGCAALVIGREWRAGSVRAGLNEAAVAAAAAAVVAGPWLARNVLTFGSAFPVPAAWLAGLASYDQLFSYSGGGPGNPDLALATALGLRAEALWHNWHRVLDFLEFPTVLLPLLGLVPLWTNRLIAGPACALLATFLGTALLFPVPTMAGTFYHDVGAFAPWLAIGWVSLLRSFFEWLRQLRNWERDLLPVGLATLVVITVAQLGLTGAAVATQHAGERERLESAATWLNAQPPGPVITDLPYNLNYVTGRPALMLPATDEPASLRQLSRRYQASTLVLFSARGRYPAALILEPACSAAAPAATFCQAGVGPGWQAYQIR